MKIKLDISVVVFLLIAAILGTFTLSYMGFSGRWIAMRNSDDTAYNKLDEAIDVIDAYFVGSFKQEDVLDGAVSGMVDSLSDRWSYYITAEEYAKYVMDIQNQYSGVGIVIEKRDGIEGIMIASVRENTPAFAAGVLPDSIVTHVNGTDIRQMDFTEASDLMSVKIDEGKLILTLINPDGLEEVVTLIPGVIEIDPVTSRMTAQDIGLIKIDNFDAKSSDQIIEAAQELLSDGAIGLIFDVRFNPGGQLGELLPTLDFLLPQGTLFISHEKGKEAAVESSDAACLDVPMAVLINADSYSAAEFFAAALQEYDWATVVGEQTTGKGYAQITVKLSDGSAIHISSSEYFTPKGVSLIDVGVAPDISLTMDDQKLTDLYYGRLADSEDDQLQAAVADIRTQVQGR